MLRPIEAAHRSCTDVDTIMAALKVGDLRGRRTASGWRIDTASLDGWARAERATALVGRLP